MVASAYLLPTCLGHSDLTHITIGGQVQADECERAQSGIDFARVQVQAGSETEPCVSKSPLIIYTLIARRLNMIENVHVTQPYKLLATP